MRYIVPLAFVTLTVTVLAVAVLARHVIHVVPDGEQHVVRRLGRFRTVRRPGLRLRVPGVEHIVRLPATPIELSFQARVNTADRRELLLDGSFELRIVDGVRYCEGHHALLRSGPETVTRALTRVVGRRRYAQFDEHAAAAEIVVDLDRHFVRFGVRVARFSIERVRPTSPDAVVYAKTA